MQELFGQPYDEADPFWLIKCYIDIIYSDGNFLKALGYIVKKWGFSTDGAYCNFPDMNSPFVEEHFEGVKFAYGCPPREEDTVIVTEEVCSKYIKISCNKYLDRHPEDTAIVKEILDSLTF